MANQQAIDKTIALIWAVDPSHFFMGDWAKDEKYCGREEDLPAGKFIHACGTSMCLAGFAAAANRPHVMATDVNAEDGKVIFDIGDREAADLFTPTTIWAGKDRLSPLSERDPERGVAVLLYLRDTGKVDWRAGYPEHFPQFPPLPKRPTPSLLAKARAMFRKREGAKRPTASGATSD